MIPNERGNLEDTGLWFRGDIIIMYVLPQTRNKEQMLCIRKRGQFAFLGEIFIKRDSVGRAF